MSNKTKSISNYGDMEHMVKFICLEFGLVSAAGNPTDTKGIRFAIKIVYYLAKYHPGVLQDVVRKYITPTKKESLRADILRAIDI